MCEMQVSNEQVQNGECIKMDYLTKHLWAICRSIYIFSFELSVLTLFACKTMVTFTVIYKEVVSLTSVDHIHKYSNLLGRGSFCIHLVPYKDVPHCSISESRSGT